jgi:heptosyltransferase-2/heptosyltransferase-3
MPSLPFPFEKPCFSKAQAGRKRPNLLFGDTMIKTVRLQVYLSLDDDERQLNEKAAASLDEKFRAEFGARLGDIGRFALMHPAAAFDAKQWPAANFARTAEFLRAEGLRTVAVASPGERTVLERLSEESEVEIVCFDDLTLSEITALASKADIFVGNDSGIAHIAAAVGTPPVVIFGSSNVDHWRPWTDFPNEVVIDETNRDIRKIDVETVAEAIERVLLKTKKRRDAMPAAVQTIEQEN